MKGEKKKKKKEKKKGRGGGGGGVFIPWERLYFLVYRMGLQPEWLMSGRLR